jgi:hypothetical protein
MYVQPPLLPHSTKVNHQAKPAQPVFVLHQGPHDCAFCYDAGITAPMIEWINKFIDGLKAKGFELTKKEASVSFWELSLRKTLLWLDPAITMTQ